MTVPLKTKYPAKLQTSKDNMETKLDILTVPLNNSPWA